ncbi:MAG: efflux RND transporter periplasmic adaptor subunit [Actinobacteria bacterium]|nr:MAG: efflux RND transporter periplasmic adaptor subunit [Actinomycetota bacterium]
MTRLKGAATIRARSVIDKGIGQRLPPLAEQLVGRAAAVHPRQWAMIAGILGLVPLSLWLGSGEQVKLEDLFEVRRGDFVAKITEPGELRALDSATISAAKDLTIIYLIPEGTFAKRGDVLARFDPGKYETQLEEAAAALDVSEADLRKAETDVEAQRHRLQADIARFEAEARFAQLDLDDLKRRPLPNELAQAKMEVRRTQAAFDYAEAKRKVLPALVEKGFITRDTLEDAELRALEAKTVLQAAQFNLQKVMAGATPEELERAQIRLEQARFALDKAKSGMASQIESYKANIERERANVERAKKLIQTAETKLKVKEVTAPKDGLVVYAKASENKGNEKIQLGMIPYEGQPILYLPDPSTIVADTEVNEVDIGKVQVGGPAELELDSFPGKVFHGTTPSGVKVFDVTVKIDDNDQRIRPGLSATVGIIVERRDNVISVPLSAVLARDGGQAVLVGNGSRIEERKVVLGPSNEDRVIVEEGLREGERVIVSPPPAEDA